MSRKVVCREAAGATGLDSMFMQLPAMDLIPPASLRQLEKHYCSHCGMHARCVPYPGHTAQSPLRFFFTMNFKMTKSVHEHVFPNMMLASSNSCMVYASAEVHTLSTPAAYGA